MKDLEAIKQYLQDLELPKNRDCFTVIVGDFVVFIHPSRSDGHSSFSQGERITQYERLDVIVYESCLGIDGEYFLDHIVLEGDPRFVDRSIKYSDYHGLSSGLDMPIAQLCSLIRLLYRLKNLAVFS